MRVTTKIARGHWLAKRIGGWARVAGVAGTGFAAYVRILHPVDAERVDVDHVDEFGIPHQLETAVWPWREVAARTGHVLHPLVQWTRMVPDEEARALPGGWRVGYTPEGWLDPVLLAALTSHLATATTSPHDVVAGIWAGWGMPQAVVVYTTGRMTRRERRRLEREQEERIAATIAPAYRDAVAAGPHLELPGREYVLLETDLAELADPAWGRTAGIGWQDGDPGPMPQLLWPEDHAWVVASEIDWDSTIVAGSRALVDAVLADDRFEAVEVGPDDDLSLTGDRVNV